MKHLLAAALLVVFGLASGVLLEQASAQKNKRKKPAFKENSIGNIPTEYGSLRSIAGATNNIVLAFESEKGEVYLFSYRGNKLNPIVDKIGRDY
ncbi:MAG: hypothetical protein AAF581_21340 [Planctomycetota bacterium]